MGVQSTLNLHKDNFDTREKYVRGNLCVLRHNGCPHPWLLSVHLSFRFDHPTKYSHINELFNCKKKSGNFPSVNRQKLHFNNNPISPFIQIMNNFTELNHIN